MEKDVIYYLNKALELAKHDRKKITDKLDFYLKPIDIKQNGLQHMREQMKMREAGYNISEETSKQVKIEMVISDLASIIWQENFRRNRK